jgi:phosphatidate phosphatase APP1
VSGGGKPPWRDPRWRDALGRAADAMADRVNDGIDRVRDEVARRRADARAPRIAPYRGYGSATELRVLARVVRDAPLPPLGERDDLWDNLVATWRRFETDEVPGAAVRARFGGTVVEGTSDREGYVDLRIPVAAAPPQAGWHAVSLELVDAPPPPATSEHGTATARVLVPSDRARFGVISDIDDTVIKSDATQLLRAARHLILGNARTRLPFPGVAAFYRALAGGVDPSTPHAATPNPLFYVSSSPWNLYELLVEIFARQGIPDGPLALRDWGVGREARPTGHHAHKRAAIEAIFTAYPQLSFVLVGDSGQEDPEIYAAVMRDFPGRVLAAYIRSVHEAPSRTAVLANLSDEMRAAGALLVVVEDTVAAARHAAAHGWIGAEQVAEVAAET